MQFVLSDCVFEHNVADSLGGAISCRNNTQVDIQITTFKGNNASKGGAVNLQNWSHLFAILCTFEDNQAQKSGGAVRARWSTILEIRFIVFSDNKASIHGGAITVLQSDLLLSNCIFEDNFAKNGRRSQFIQ